MIHSKTKFIAILGAALFGVSLATFVGFMFITEGHKTHLSERTKELALAGAQRDAMSSLVETLERTEQERIELASRIIGEKQVIELVELIELVGREQGVVLTTKSITEDKLNDIFDTLTIRLGAEGSYESIMHVLAVLEQLPYQSSVTSVLITSVGEEGFVGWSATFEIVVTKSKASQS
jgi:hypothetical protein